MSPVVCWALPPQHVQLDVKFGNHDYKGQPASFATALTKEW